MRLAGCDRIVTSVVRVVCCHRVRFVSSLYLGRHDTPTLHY